VIFFTELQNLPAYDVKGNDLGTLVDLGLDPNNRPFHVSAYLFKSPGGNFLCGTHDQIQSISVRAIQTRVPVDEVRCYMPDEGQIRIKKDVLDQQIIDINERKVVRVIDVDFDIEPQDGRSDLRIVAVDVGWPAAVRRLLQGLLAKHKIRRVANMFEPQTIPWEFVSLIEADPARRVKLRIAYSRLSRLHPADIADILEELSRDEQRSVIETLDAETAAETVSEIPTRMQVALLNSLPAEHAADILEEMDPDEAADVLQELPPETSAEVLARMEVEEAEEVRELLGFEENTAGGLMTTEFIALADGATIEEAVQTMKAFSGNIESVHAIYTVDANFALTGTVPLARILLAETGTTLSHLKIETPTSVPFHADEKSVVDIFHKYDLLELPVVDDDGRLLGVVTADDVLEIVVNR
jgi:magnesium transporter